MNNTPHEIELLPELRLSIHNVWYFLRNEVCTDHLDTMDICRVREFLWSHLHPEAPTPVAAEVEALKAVHLEALNTVRDLSVAKEKLEADLATAKDQLLQAREAFTSAMQGADLLGKNAATYQSELREAKARIEELERKLKQEIEGKVDPLYVAKIETELAASNEAREALQAELATTSVQLAGASFGRDMFRAIWNSTLSPNTQPASHDIKGESVPVALVEQLAEALKNCQAFLNEVKHALPGHPIKTMAQNLYLTIRPLLEDNYAAYKSGAPSKVSEVLGEVETSVKSFLDWIANGRKTSGKWSVEYEQHNYLLKVESALAKLAALRKGHGV